MFSFDFIILQINVQSRLNIANLCNPRIKEGNIILTSVLLSSNEKKAGKIGLPWIGNGTRIEALRTTETYSCTFRRFLSFLLIKNHSYAYIREGIRGKRTAHARIRRARAPIIVWAVAPVNCDCGPRKPPRGYILLHGCS